ncbi:hypothetical protein a10_04368 [Streptomyces acidiscabies]|nr:hypothetical protein a10_04368 [Streptomyces acidiscabies]
MRQVDTLFSKALLYFDEIVVAGPSPYNFARPLEKPNDQTKETLLAYMETLIYLRNIGVRDMLIFNAKPPACEVHLAQDAEAMGVAEVIEQSKVWVQRLETDGILQSVEVHDDHSHYAFIHQDLEHTVWGSTPSVNPTKREVAESVFSLYAAHLVSDIRLARRMGLPLAAQVQLHEDALSGGHTKGGELDIALSLQLPILSQLPVRDIVRMRQDEWDAFERFRNALKVSIKERVSQGISTLEASEEILDDVITPALNDISQRLRVTGKKLERKLGAASLFGTVGMTVGLLSGMPLVVGGAVAATITSLPALQRYFDDKGEVELSDMYFLWKLEQRHGGHRRK